MFWKLVTTCTVLPWMGGEEEIPLHFQPLRPDKIQPKLMEKMTTMMMNTMMTMMMTMMMTIDHDNDHGDGDDQTWILLRPSQARAQASVPSLRRFQKSYSILILILLSLIKLLLRQDLFWKSPWQPFHQLGHPYPPADTTSHLISTTFKFWKLTSAFSPCTPYSCNLLAQ